MKALFSQRHSKSVFAKETNLIKQKLFLSPRLRHTIERIFAEIEEEEQQNCHNSWDYTNTIEGAQKYLHKVMGPDALTISINNAKSNLDFIDVIRKGLPRQVFDCIEAWFYLASDPWANIAEKELNEAFSINESPWRVLSGEMLLIDSEYLYAELVSKQVDFMKALSVNGAMDEFQTALREFQQGEFAYAITEAAKSVESTLKFVMSDNAKTDLSGLLKMLRKADLVPSYYNNLFESFTKIVQATGLARNQPGHAHGQGCEVVNSSKSLAEFQINLAASVNKFLLACYMEKKECEKAVQTVISVGNSDNEIPF
ncbi:MAG: putative cytoplasmic protein [Firmicutes bacterium]|nr:putative cytoplasmic protein [Bacillota bacterium]